MKAIVWQGPERMTIEERPDPGDPEAGELIVRPQAVGSPWRLLSETPASEASSNDRTSSSL